MKKNSFLPLFFYQVLLQILQILRVDVLDVRVKRVGRFVVRDEFAPLHRAEVVKGRIGMGVRVVAQEMLQQQISIPGLVLALAARLQGTFQRDFPGLCTQNHGHDAENHGHDAENHGHDAENLSEKNNLTHMGRTQHENV